VLTKWLAATLKRPMLSSRLTMRRLQLLD
jgi:hypothetical protein